MKCPLCKNYGHLEHILNYCSVALEQKRFTWRHNSVLSHFTSKLKKVKPIEIEIYSDLEGHTFNGGTIPPDILCTKQRPDMVIINRSKKKVHFLELEQSNLSHE